MQINEIVIVGGGTSGWMTAAALSNQFEHLLKKQSISITLIESDDIGTVGVGEATLPHLRFFNQKLGIDEREFMSATKATYKLGIEFCHWAQLGDCYMHAFGEYGKRHQNIEFHQWWLRAKDLMLAKDITQYSMAAIAAKNNKFQHPKPDQNSMLSRFNYAYHIDAGLYAKFLRDYSHQRGVVRIEGKISQVKQAGDSGFIQSLCLDSGQIIDGDLFIDCSGFKGLLISESLKVKYHDWSHYLPCDSAQAVPSERPDTLITYTRASARSAGWQWRIPLQHRTGNGYVYCSSFCEDQHAQDELLMHLDGNPIREPIQLRFITGKRDKFWDKNVVSIGLSGGFMEPLESTSIYLIQEAIGNLIDLFPDADFSAELQNEFNRLMDEEFYHIRDFLIAHYHVNNRDDSDFWRYVRNMQIPDTLAHKLSVFETQGHIVNYGQGEFLAPSWLAVLIGQKLKIKHYHPSVDVLDTTELTNMMENIENDIYINAAAMKNHEDSLMSFLANKSSKEYELYSRLRASKSLYGTTEK